MKLSFKEPLITNGDVTVKITEEGAKALGLNLTEDYNYAEIETIGPWQIISKYKALVVSVEYSHEMYTKTLGRRFYNRRSLSNIKQEGYHLEGFVSIKGKKYSAFTSSVLFDVEGKLIDVAVIHARMNNQKNK